MFFIVVQGAFQRHSAREVALTCPASPQYEGQWGSTYIMLHQADTQKEASFYTSIL